MHTTLPEPTPFDYLEIQEKLDEISSEEPFEILYYGSRERGDHDWNSDFNFYLLASTQDQMRPGFIQKINHSFKVMEKIAPVNLVAGDKETFRVRMNLFDPCILHMLDKATVFYGEHIFHNFQKEWEELSKKPIPRDRLLAFLRRRKNFYKNLKSRTEKDNAIRMERIATLDIQIWVLENISDLTVPELIHLDIPNYCNEMVRELYKNEWNADIKQLVVERNRWRSKKRDYQFKQLGLMKDRVHDYTESLF